VCLGEIVCIVWVGDVFICVVVEGIDIYELNCNFVLIDGVCVDLVLNFEIEIG